MKKKLTPFAGLFSVVLLFPAVCLVVTGCGTSREKPLLSRGWIGGQVSVERSFPTNLIPRPKAALLVTSLATNTPAALAGIRAGDLILAVHHQPIEKLRAFRRKIDALAPGASVPVSVFRNGRVLDYTIIAGRETYHKGGVFTVYFPVIASGWSFWPHGEHPCLSLVALGYQNNSVNRVELGSVRQQYDLKCNSTNTPYTEDYKIWLGIVELSKGKRIATQKLADAHN